MDTPPLPPPLQPPIPDPVYYPPPPKNGGPKWILLGCGGCLGLLVLGGIAIAIFFYAAAGALKKSDAYATSVRIAHDSPQVQAALGTPVEDGWLIQGSFKVVNDTGDIDMEVPLKGPKGEGKLTMKGKKVSGSSWDYSVLEFLAPDGSTIDLRAPSASEPAP